MLIPTNSAFSNILLTVDFGLYEFLFVILPSENEMNSKITGIS